MSSASSQSLFHKPTTYDELSMQQRLLFQDSLKDLRSLRAQLYSAAEYFEVCYTNDDQKQLVVDTLKDYAIKAFINTVDHLGSVTYKVNGIMEQSVSNVAGIQVQASCMEQKLQTCQKFIDGQGLLQQSSMLRCPKFHKRYLLPVGETMGVTERRPLLKHQWCSLDDEDDWHQFKNAVLSSLRDSPSAVRKGRSPSPSLRSYMRPGTTFSFTDKQSNTEKREASPLRSMFPLKRTGSHSSRSTTPVTSRPTTPVTSRPTTPSSSNTRQRCPSEPRRSASMRFHAEKESSKDSEQYPTKSKRLLKALLSRRKSRKDEALYTFLDEY